MSKIINPSEQVFSPSRRRAGKMIATGLVAAAPVIMKPRRLISAADGREAPLEITGTSKTKRSIALFNSNTGEHFDGVYWEGGQYDKRMLEHINYIFRDHRENSITEISADLIDLLYDVQQRLRGRAIHVVSGYRTEKTNARLRRLTSGVARNSYHIKGMAADIRVPGISTKTIRNVAQSKHIGGVGWYPRSGFVHVDTGPVRYW